MQKLVILILAMVVLTASLAPCCPDDNCQDEITQTGSEEQERDGGSCSPFFACCSGFVQLAKHYSVPVLLIEPPTHFERSLPDFYSTYYSSFFQPPRQVSFEIV